MTNSKHTKPAKKNTDDELLTYLRKVTDRGVEQLHQHLGGDAGLERRLQEIHRQAGK